MLNRGLTKSAESEVEHLIADRRDVESMAKVVRGRGWDAVIDTWSGTPDVVLNSSQLLAGNVGHFGYVSSRSVYRWPMPEALDERSPVVEGDVDESDEENYPAVKRGSELAALATFPDQTLIARAGLILGPYEYTGRMVWWLRRIQRGGQILAPGPADQGIQYIDARDLAAWMLRCAEAGVTGTFNTVCPSEQTNMGEVLNSAAEVVGSQPQFRWVSPEWIEAAGLAAWTELPLWLPPTQEYAGMRGGNVSAAQAAGLTFRPVRETISDTWAWLCREGDPDVLSDQPALGIDAGRELELLAALG